jgi:hypothetical protein
MMVLAEGLAHLEAGRSDVARALAEAALAADPDGFEALRLTGLIEWRAGQRPARSRPCSARRPLLQTRQAAPPL